MLKWILLAVAAYLVLTRRASSGLGGGLRTLTGAARDYGNSLDRLLGGGGGPQAPEQNPPPVNLPWSPPPAAPSAIPDMKFPRSVDFNFARARG